MDFVDFLPEKLLVLIFNFLSFRSVHYSCILVSRKWFKFIRNNLELSGELYISPDLPPKSKIDSERLLNWPQLSINYPKWHENTICHKLKLSEEQTEDLNDKLKRNWPQIKIIYIPKKTENMTFQRLKVKSLTKMINIVLDTKWTIYRVFVNAFFSVPI